MYKENYGLEMHIILKHIIECILREKNQREYMIIPT